MNTNKLISIYISNYSYWARSRDYWERRYDAADPYDQGLYTKSEILERVNRAAKHVADAKANLEELLGCEITLY